LAEIRANDYDLSFNKYKKTEYKAVEYPSTSEIYANLRRIETEIAKRLEELEGML
jgi:type I restriction enzyme M protein